MPLRRLHSPQASPLPLMIKGFLSFAAGLLFGALLCGMIALQHPKVVSLVTKAWEKPLAPLRPGGEYYSSGKRSPQLKEGKNDGTKH